MLYEFQVSLSKLTWLIKHESETKQSVFFLTEDALYDKCLIQSVGVRSSERDITVGRLICQSAGIVVSHPLLKSFRVSLPSAMEPEAERWWCTLYTRPAIAVWPPDSSSRDGEVIWPDPAEDWQSQIQYHHDLHFK